MLTRLTLWMTFLVLGVMACATPRVEMDIRGNPDLSAFTTVYVPPAIIARGGPDPIAPEIGESLQVETKLQLARRGYLFAAPAQADLRVELYLRRGVMARRTWSSDPDASAAVYRDFPAAVLEVQVLDPRDSSELWRGEGRARLPERRNFFDPDPETIWLDTLGQVLDALPVRAPSAS